MNRRILAGGSNTNNGGIFSQGSNAVLNTEEDYMHTTSYNPATAQLQQLMQQLVALIQRSNNNMNAPTTIIHGL